MLEKEESEEESGGANFIYEPEPAKPKKVVRKGRKPMTEEHKEKLESLLTLNFQSPQEAL